MTALPLPGTLGPHVSLESRANRSLVFDRGFGGYDPRWSAIPPGAKQEFLAGFRRKFSRPADYKPFLERRSQALEAAGAFPIERTTQTRLVIGLGLPHPTETALLLDRLTGCPYLPGSSVKGLLREAARLAAAGELDTGEGSDPAFWKDHLDRLFGPLLGGDATPARGELLLHDAFPDRWPTLEVDVLTPHYQPYYGDDLEKPTEPPADWHDPVPVAFLTVQAGTPFTFWVSHSAPEPGEDLDRAQRLLRIALDNLGAGGKTSSGYGVFGDEPPPPPKVVPVPTESGTKPLPPVPRPLKPGEARWQGASLLLDKGRPTVKGPGGQKAAGYKEDVPEAVFERLRQGVVLQADAIVKERRPGTWSLVRIEGTEF